MVPLENTAKTDEQCDPPKSRIGRFLMESLLAATG